MYGGSPTEEQGRLVYTSGPGQPLPGRAAAAQGSAVFTLASLLVGGIAGSTALSFQAGLGSGWTE